ncbi:MtrAB system accessory lipoprotein LpqB [Corynebacterium sp. SA-MJD20WY100]|uniref:MtrAB system accessory lipoprotein LpqB n=1 Tax=Corynebacterium sp. SA-MJD20WY100 TaxID=3142969 RepID=UPI003221F57F
MMVFPNPRHRASLHRPARTVLAVASVVALAGCSTLPSNTAPQVLRSFAPQQEAVPVVGPQPGQEPDLLLRDFYRASAIPSGDYAAARAFLTDDATQSWEPQGSVLLVDAIDLNSASAAAEADTEERAFSVRGNVIGSLEDGGAYRAENGAYEATVKMKMVDGQWRISDLPAGVVIERNELRNQYQPESLYFFDRDQRSLISDRRWVFSGSDTLDSQLITLLMQGPSATLAPAVTMLTGNDAAFAGIEDGAYRFTGLSGLDEEDRMHFAAELVWTLSNAGVAGPYKVIADGAALVPGMDEMTTDDFAEYNPRAAATQASNLYALNGGNILSVTGTIATPVGGLMGRSGRLESAEISTEGTVAAVTQLDDGKSQLLMGDLDGTPQRSVEADTISRPSFENSGEAAWAVVDGKRVSRFVQSSATGRIVETEVDTSALDDIDGEISVLRLSTSGARVALIVGGKIYTGVTVREDGGAYRIANITEIASELGGMALSLDWQPDGSLVVGTSSPDTPVWRVEQDGSAVSTLPSGNITAPVVSVAATQTTIFATDAHATLQVSAEDSTSAFWREVPGLQGMRSAPIVAK